MLSMYEDLSNFRVITEEMHITRAAQRLHMSQQTLSNCVRRLEKDCGTALFERHPHLRLTAAGELFLAHVSSVLEQADQLSSQLEELRSERSGRLKIGVNQTQSQTTLPPVLHAFFREYPCVKTEVTICPVYDLTKKLLDGDIDLLFRASRKNLPCECEFTEITSDRLCLCIPSELLEAFYPPDRRKKLIRLSPAQQLDRLTADGFLQGAPFVLNGPWLSAFARKFFRRRGIAPEVLLEFHDTEMLFTLGYADMGITFIHSNMIPLLPHRDGKDNAYAVVPLEEPSAALPVFIVTPRNRPLTWSAKKFIETAQSVYAPPQAGR